MGEALQEGTGQRWRDGPKIYSVPTIKDAGSVFGVEKKIQEPTFISVSYTHLTLPTKRIV